MYTRCTLSIARNRYACTRIYNFFVYICTHTYLHLYIDIYVYIHAYTQTHLYTYIHLHVYISWWTTRTYFHTAARVRTLIKNPRSCHSRRGVVGEPDWQTQAPPICRRLSVKCTQESHTVDDMNPASPNSLYCHNPWCLGV